MAIQFLDHIQSNRSAVSSERSDRSFFGRLRSMELTLLEGTWLEGHSCSRIAHRITVVNLGKNSRADRVIAVRE